MEPTFVIEEVTDPDEIARFRAQDKRARLNMDWLQAHWSDLLPAARGKFIAVAGQEAFIADTAEEAWERQWQLTQMTMARSTSTSALSVVHGSMQVSGEWFRCDDGVTRPIVRARIIGTGFISQKEIFLLDSGPDRTVFRAALVNRLRFSIVPSEPGLTLAGIGGASAYISVVTRLELARDDGIPVSVRGQYLAFTTPAASDMSILGRDVLDNFDVIVSKPRNEVLLLAPNHHYRVVRA